jgi:hypothetical protein
MSYRILRLIAPLLIIATLLVGQLPSRAVGQSAAAPFHIYLPLVSGSAGASADQTTINDGFTEVSGARTAYTSLAMGQVNGRTVARIRRYAQPTFYYDATSDSWLPINTTLVADGGSYRNAAGSFSARFSAGGSSTPLLELGRAGEPSITLATSSGSAPTPIVGTAVITYPAALGTASLVYRSEPWGVKEEIVIGAAGAPASYDLHIGASGLRPERQADGGYLLRNTSGAALWRVPAPVGSDANGALAPLTLSITPDAAGMLVRLTVDAAWLADPARAFPVRLDPSLADPQYISGDTYVQSAAPTILSYDQRNRFIGYSALKGIARIYTSVDLSVLPSGITPTQVLAARLVFTQYVAQSSAGGFASSVYTVPSAWSDLTLNWNNQPAAGTRISGAQVSQALEQKRWDITAWAQSVIAGQAANNGLSIRADNEALGGGTFWSHNCQTAKGQCPDEAADHPFLELEVALDSGLKPSLDTWAWPNREGLPSFEQYAKDYGVPVTTHLITETRVLKVISATNALSLPIGLDAVGIHGSIPLSVTANLTSTQVVSGTASSLIPRPISYLYEEVVVKAVYDDQFSAYYSAAMKGGLCLGMAATVADFYANGGPSPSAYGGTTSVRSIPDQAPAQEFIQTYHGRQVGSAVLNWMAGPGRMGVQAYYDRLAASIGGAAWHSDPEIVGVLKGTGCNDVEIGHALLPYKLVPMSGNRARVYVYDSNYPPASDADADNRYIDLDLVNKTWTYELAPATATHPAVIWSGSQLFSTPLHLISQKPVQPTASGTDIIALEGGHSQAFGGHSQAFGGHSQAFGTDTETNTHTGCVATPGQQPTFMQDVSHSIRITPLTGGNTSTFPDALFFPAGRPMAFTGVGANAGGIGDTMVFGPRGLMGYLTPAGASTSDTLSTDATFLRASLSTSDPSKPASLYQMHETDDWTRVYALNNTSIDASAPLVAEVSPDLGSLTVINTGHARSYDLGLGHYGGEGVGQAIFPAQPIGANERRVYTPMLWRNVAHSPVLVQIDLGNDGTIDRVELIGGDLLPAVASLADAPTTPGAELTLIDHDLGGDNFGWVDLDHPLAPGQQPPAEGDDHDDDGNDHGDDPARMSEGGEGDDDEGHAEDSLARWLAQGGNPGLTLGGGLIGVPGKHEDLARAVPGRAPEHKARYQPGDLVLVPLYDQISGGHDRPVLYQIGGFALVEILAHDNHGDHDDDHDDGHGRPDAGAQLAGEDGGHEGEDGGYEGEDGAIHTRLVARFAR